MMKIQFTIGKTVKTKMTVAAIVVQAASSFGVNCNALSLSA